jgi:hypothetical protein
MSSNNPIVLADFGATASNPSFISTVNGGVLRLFTQPQVGVSTPPPWNTEGKPNNWNLQGLRQMPGQLLYAPNTGSLNGKIYRVVAAGSVELVAPEPATATFNLMLNQNYPTLGVFPASRNTLFTLTNPITVTVGEGGFGLVEWSLSGTLAGNGRHTSVLSFGGALTATNFTIPPSPGVTHNGNGFSNNPVARTEPKIQLSLGLIFGGNNPTKLGGVLTQFQIQQQQF